MGEPSQPACEQPSVVHPSGCPKQRDRETSQVGRTSEMVRLRAEKDFYAGLLYVAMAGAFLWFGRNYKVGTAALMGPGYFPTVLAWLLAALGTASVLKSFGSDGERVG